MMLLATRGTSVADLRPGDDASPIEIRVVREWLSYGFRGDCCFLFVDRDGIGIQASASSTECSYFKCLLKVGMCYRVANYICEPAKTYMASVPHAAGIRIGKAATFDQIPDDGFPRYCFNFAAYGDFRHRVGKTDILKDYIGKYEHVTKPYNGQQADMVKLILRDVSGPIVEATFWSDMASAVDIKAIKELPSPAIIALARMKVTSYINKLQLEYTPASCVYINPDIPQAESIAHEFVSGDILASKLNVTYDKSPDVETEKLQNRFTLAQLLCQSHMINLSLLFTCAVTIKDIDVSKGWFYKGCDQCNKKLLPRGSSYACEDHNVIQPRDVSFFSMIISDCTAQCRAVFFDNTASMLVGSECKEILDHCVDADPFVLPPSIACLKGATRVLQIRYCNSSKPGNVEFVVNHVFDEPITKVTNPTHVI